jgi:hypothetical protein
MKSEIRLGGTQLLPPLVEKGSNTFLRNYCNYLPDYTPSHPMATAVRTSGLKVERCHDTCKESTADTDEGSFLYVHEFSREAKGLEHRGEVS